MSFSGRMGRPHCDGAEWSYGDTKKPLDGIDAQIE
jgi:hypothetical protein